MIAYKIVVTALFGVGAILFAARAVAAFREREWRTWTLFWLNVAGAAMQLGLAVWTAVLGC